MADSNAVGGLRWVKDEIVASLQGVRGRLEEFVEHGPDPQQSHLDDAVTALSEVRGVLAALELIGPARLAEEMQTLCEDLVAESVPNTQEASEALMLALIQLPDYLDKVDAGQADVPLALMPPVNDLRTSRGAAPLTEAELLVPTSVLADTEMPPPDVQASWRQIAGNVRPQFHMHLLQWFRDETSRQGLVDLGGLFHRLQRSNEEGIFHELFLVAEAMVEALLEGSITEDAKSKALVAHLDRIIKPLATNPQAWPEAEAQTLLFDLLSAIARCESSSYLVNELRAFYGLDQDSWGEGGAPTSLAGGAGPEAFAVLVAEARKELAPITDALDLFARGDRSDPEQLLRLEPQLRTLANTLAVTGADDLAARLHRCGDELEALGRGGGSADDRHLMKVAEELLAVEVALGDLGPGDKPVAERKETRALIASTLSEARVDIAKAERAISDLVDKPADHRALSEVPNLFRRVAGALRILAESEVAAVLDLVVKQIEQRILETAHAPVQSELDLLAQAISGIDLYVEGLRDGKPYRADLIAQARTAIEELQDVPMPSLARAVDEPTHVEKEPSAETIEPQGPVTPVTRIDPEFLDIFLEEAEEEEQTIRDQFARWKRDGSDEDALATLRRSFHTLKGSGRLVGALGVGEFARAVEMLLNRVIDGTRAATPDLMAYMSDAVDVLPDLIAAEAQQHPRDASELIARAESLAMSADQQAATAPVSPVDEPKAAKVIPWPAKATSPVSEEAPEEVAAGAGASEEEEAAEIAALTAVDEELLDIFRTEAQENLEVLRSFLARGEAEGASQVPDEPVVRALHTLTGSARMTEVESAAKVTAPLERLFLAHQGQGSEPEPSLLGLLGRAIDALQERLENLPSAGKEMATLRGLGEDLQARLALLEGEGEEKPEAPEDVTASAPVTEEEAEETLALQATETTGTEEEVVVAPEFPDEAITSADISGLEVLEETLAEEVISAPQTPPEPIPEEVAATAEAPEPAPPEKAAPTVEITDQEVPEVAAADLVPLPEDPELITLFLDDARGLVDRLDQSLRDLQLAPTESAPLEEMQRSLHTLKGSARLSGLAPIGDLSHAFESLLTAITHGKASVDDDTLELSQTTLDTLSDQIDAVGKHSDLRRADDLVQALTLVIEKGLAGPSSTAPQVAVMAPSPATAGGPGAEIVRESRAPAKPAPPSTGAVAEAAAPLIRVRADLINRLINNAGEISIYRSRLSQQGGRMIFRLGELDRTVMRLREQLRHLEIETEAQILYRYERDAGAMAPDQEEGFDPLELDRFSILQQLSRSLAETVNDLVSLRTLLHDLQSESDTLLQQQARISDDLQDGLLRTRMVPFAQAVPRLHRVVRQTAQQMGKEASLEVFGPEVELDRSIQERILAPLEHLLRNAVAHGIEPPKQRRRVGKPPSGVITLILNREGNDVVITVADDGAGLDLQAIRKRALDEGLIAASTDVRDDELTGLILESGFTTAKKVSQIAGRGVGLDVVNAEVKQLSGSFNLETEPGRGTSFTIRLPLTLAIIEALLVQLGDQIFAIPHTTIEAVSRIPRADLEDCYQGDGGIFSYAGREFRLMYLGSTLQPSGMPDLGERRWLPVVLARAGEQRIAFHVDQLMGNQRVVVKPLGPELSSIRWLNGATILPDGRVAMILDLLTLIRSKAVQDYHPPIQRLPQERKQRPCVMVVDDSLTVRRVTSRMLQRQNIEVITAQDGIDALTRLEDRVPDVILLDIEMPRMDGYELTRHIRRSERLKDIPLIMITSRTGEKHRRHALDLGVNRYLGKPYQETDLLDEISSVLVEASL